MMYKSLTRLNDDENQSYLELHACMQSITMQFVNINLWFENGDGGGVQNERVFSVALFCQIDWGLREKITLEKVMTQAKSQILKI